jgi:2-amino-4-hydroxy-6-hydroxymethyldihydropteridine diphosphokinase
MITTYIGVGSNIERKKHVQAALSELRKLGEQIRISTVYECASVGFESRPFYNLVVEMKTSLSLRPRRTEDAGSDFRPRYRALWRCCFQ